MKKQCSYTFEWHIADFYEKLKENVFLIFLVIVFDDGGGSCFFLQLTCSQFKILCKFQVYSNVICLYLCMYICFLNIVPSGCSFKFEVISHFKEILTLKLMKWCLLFNLVKLSFRNNSKWALFQAFGDILWIKNFWPFCFLWFLTSVRFSCSVVSDARHLMYLPNLSYCLL